MPRTCSSNEQSSKSSKTAEKFNEVDQTPVANVNKAALKNVKAKISPKTRKRSNSNDLQHQTPIEKTSAKSKKAKKQEVMEKPSGSKYAKLDRGEIQQRTTTVTIPDDDRYMEMTVQANDDLDYENDPDQSEEDQEISFRNSQSSQPDEDSTDRSSSEEDNLDNAFTTDYGGDSEDDQAPDPAPEDSMLTVEEIDQQVQEKRIGKSSGTEGCGQPSWAINR